MAGEITPEAALAAWPKADGTIDKLEQKAWHLLCHYSIDDDIRAKDKTYETCQRRSIEEVMTVLRQTRPVK